MAPASAAPLFVDTSAWVALTHRPDQSHRRAVELWARVRLLRPLVTTALVMAEAHALLRRRIGAEPAGRFVERLLGPGQRLVWAEPVLARAAVDRWLLRYTDQGFSLTDAVSFEVMRREGIREAFAFDRDFERAGFRLLNEPKR